MPVIGIRGLNLILTAQCNLRCSYCYQNAKGLRRMDRETLGASVDLALSSPRDSADFVFVGGEPLVEFDLLRRAIEYTERLVPAAKQVAYRISTNGTLITDEVADFLAKHRVYTQLSFDGVAAAQDLRSRGTFAALDRLLDRLRERHPRYYGSCLITSITVVPTTVRHLADSVGYFLSKGVAKIAITPSITPYGRWRKSDISELEAQFTRILDSSLRHLEQTGEVPLALFRGDGGDSWPSCDEPSAEGERPGPGSAASSTAPDDRGGLRRARMMCGILENAMLTVDVDGQVYGCGLYARSVNDLRSPLHLGCLSAMRLGDVRDPELGTRYERFVDVVRRLPVHAAKEWKYSAYGRCVDCPHFDICTICPVSLGYIEGNTDPNRVPDFACAFNLVSLGCRERFPIQPGLRARVVGEPYRDEMERWASLARSVGPRPS